MRYLLLSALFVLPALAAAQDATWIWTDGPGFTQTTDLVLDAGSQPLIEASAGTLVFSDGAWLPYTAERGVLTVIDEDHFVTAFNFLDAGSGQSPFTEYQSTIRVWLRAAGGDDMLGQFTYEGGPSGGFAEQALVSPDGDVWVGI